MATLISHKSTSKYVSFEDQNSGPSESSSLYQSVNVYNNNNTSTERQLRDKKHSFRKLIYCCCCCSCCSDNSDVHETLEESTSSPLAESSPGRSYNVRNNKIPQDNNPKLLANTDIDEDSLERFNWNLGIPKRTGIISEINDTMKYENTEEKKEKGKVELKNKKNKEIDYAMMKQATEFLLAAEKIASSTSLENKYNTRSKRKIMKERKPLETKVDESYNISDVSSGLATLPKRSNSPLKHQKDFERSSQFPINRSGPKCASIASVYSGAGEATRETVTVRGEVQFSLLYNNKLGALEVGVKRCRDLAPVDTKRNRSNPYVKVYLLPDKSKTGKRKTKVKKNTLNPVFEETLNFRQPLASLSSRTLWLSVWHADKFGRNDFLGEVNLPLAGVVFDDPAALWYKLHEMTERFDKQQGTRGDLIIGLKFEPQETNLSRGNGTLHVLVKEAKNLVASKPNGLADVFCKSYLLPERGRLAKQKTNVVSRTLNPRWERTLLYRNVNAQELASRALELSLWDHDRFASNEFMGAVRLSLGTGVYMDANVNWMDSTGKEVSLWQAMLQSPNLWVEGSLPLRPQLNN